MGGTLTRDQGLMEGTSRSQRGWCALGKSPTLPLPSYLSLGLTGKHRPARTLRVCLSVCLWVGGGAVSSHRAFSPL